MHATTSESALLDLDILTQISTWCHRADNLRLRVVGMSIVDTVDIGEQHEGVGIHHLGDQTTELIVIREHQLCDAYRIVLIDDGQHVVFQHHLHAGTLVLILFARLKILLHRQHLTYMDAELTEQVVVKTDELHLS